MIFETSLRFPLRRSFSLKLLKNALFTMIFTVKTSLKLLETLETSLKLL